MGIVIQLNGEEREVAPGSSLEDLVAAAGLAPEQVAVEVNQELVPRGARGDWRVQPGDAVELVTLVGGG